MSAALRSATLLLVLGWALSGCSRHAQAGPTPAAVDAVILSSDQATLRESDVSTFLDGLDADARSRALQDPQLLQRLLKRELGRRALLLQAQRQQWEQRPDVAAQIERARTDVILDSYLRSVAAPPDNYPSAAELQQAYQLNQQRFLSPRSYRLAQIFIASPADPAGQAAAAAKARRLAAQLKAAPARFADVARAESDDKASAAQGGDLGPMAETQLAPAIRSIAEGLGQGEVSDPVQVSGGWHILRLLETQPAALRPFDQVKPELTALLRQQRTQENAAAYFNKLLADQHAAVDESVLQKLAAAGASHSPDR
jgi:parvulin-like peptidyl-prolyl isomerase